VDALSVVLVGTARRSTHEPYQRKSATNSGF
jgi:hypothetical protein